MICAPGSYGWRIADRITAARGIAAAGVRYIITGAISSNVNVTVLSALSGRYGIKGALAATDPDVPPSAKGLVVLAGVYRITGIGPTPVKSFSLIFKRLRGA